MRGRWVSGVVVMLCLAAGCQRDPASAMQDPPDAGEDGGGQPADARPDAADSRSPVADTGVPPGFVGTWVYESGNEVLACMGKPTETHSLIGVVLVLAVGTTAPLVVSGDSCKVEFDVSGDVATARPSQMCKQSDGTSTLTYTVMSYTLTLQDLMAVEMSAWGIDFADPSGNLKCAYTTTGRLRKIR